MPFITEEIWSKIKSDSEDSLIISNWPEISESNSLVIDNFEKIKELISGIRKYRKEKNISFKEKLTFFSKAKFEKKSSSVILKELQDISFQFLLIHPKRHHTFLAHNNRELPAIAFRC